MATGTDSSITMSQAEGDRDRDRDRRSGSPTRSERSQTSADDPDSLDLTGPNPTRDALADGIVSLLSPTLKTLDEGVLSTKRSQEELSEQIALLTDQLKLISAEQLCPIDLDGYVNRLGTIKGKINVISSVLHSAQDRLARVHEQALKETARRKPLLEPSPVTSPAFTSQLHQTIHSTVQTQTQFQSSTGGSGSASSTSQKDPTEDNENNVVDVDVDKSPGAAPERDSSTDEGAGGGSEEKRAP